MASDIPDDAVVLNGGVVKFWAKVLVGVTTSLVLLIGGGLARDYIRGINQQQQIDRIEATLDATPSEEQLQGLEDRLDRMENRLVYIQRYVTEQDPSNSQNAP